MKHFSTDIAKAYAEAVNNGQAFAAYRLPNATTINHISGAVTRDIQTEEQGFVFSSFNPLVKPHYIKASQKTLRQNQNLLPRTSDQKSTTKKDYTALVKNCVSKIKSGEYKKIVAARVLAMDKAVSFDELDFFQILCEHYHTAFVSIVYIPAVGLWIGASPEVLVSEASHKITTYSLAGTKAIDDMTDWGEKEKMEQAIVTDFVRDKLRRSLPLSISMDGPKTHEAGSIKHLLSVFTTRYQGRGHWKEVVGYLHPTPAVAGVPNYKAAKFLSKEEGFDRKFYAGYLGPVNERGKTNIFVNLRCVEVLHKRLLFYAGCGITAESNAEKEWQESERKIGILKGLI